MKQQKNKRSKEKNRGEGIIAGKEGDEIRMT